jgi:NAD(P)-dependent dehydrogenase (short-subunit alcohol dehydrogenase family)
MSKILITGTSRGIGLATALAFGRAGHEVYATMRNPQQAPELAQTAAAEGLRVHISAMDVDSDNSVVEAIAGILEQSSGIDVLVNNAGIDRAGAVEELPLAEFRQTMETNYFGTIRCIQALVGGMRARGSGCIINIASVAGKISSSPLTPYSASKFAVEALSEGLAQEMKPHNVRVAIVEPGIIDTAMARRIEVPPPESKYPQVHRFSRMFLAALQQPVSPSVVADKILEIADSGTWQLRHPVGPDAEPFLAWRAAMGDEEWVDWGAKSDDEWYDALEKDFGLDARP